LESSRGREVTSEVRPASEFASFALVPGTNKISLFTDSLIVTAFLIYKEVYWGISGAS